MKLVGGLQTQIHRYTPETERDNEYFMQIAYDELIVL